MNIETIATREQQWALGEGSIDFGSFDLNDDDDSDDNDPTLIVKPMNDCSHASTLSTAGESGSWSFECSLNASALTQLLEEEEEEDDNDSDDSNESLKLEDLYSFYVEDQVGIFNPDREDTPQSVRRQSQLALQARRESMKNDLPPPPKEAADFKGDSQNSFTLDDLAFEPEADQEENSNDDSLGDLLSPPPSRRRSSRKDDIQSILKTASSHSTTKRRSSSLTLLMMEDSSLFQMSESCAFEDDDDDEDNSDWALMMNQSLDVNAVLDLQQQQDEEQPPDRHVQFSTVIVHQHAQVLGDNPSVSEGAPLMLDWTAEESTTYPSIDDYEQHRHPTAMPVRKLDAEERMWRLLDAGVTLQEIQLAEVEAGRTRAERESTRQTILLGGTKPVFYKYIQKNSRQRADLTTTRRRKSPCRG